MLACLLQAGLGSFPPASSVVISFTLLMFINSEHYFLLTLGFPIQAVYVSFDIFAGIKRRRKEKKGKKSI
jgi:hypothetical protein